jgi:hypothetical protein
MPISQERFMQVITGAKRIMLLLQAVQETMLFELGPDMVNANSVLAQSNDASAKQVITKLLDRIATMREVFMELQGTDTATLMAIILAEEIHFNKAKRKNTKARYYQEQARRERGATKREPMVELKGPQITERSTPLTEPEQDITQSKGYQQFLADRQKYYANWPNTNTLSPTLATEDTIAKQENEKTFGTLELNAAAESELKLMQTAQLKMRKATYAPSVLATSVPSLEELNAPPLKPGDKLL